MKMGVQEGWNSRFNLLVPRTLSLNERKDVEPLQIAKKPRTLPLPTTGTSASSVESRYLNFTALFNLGLRDYSSEISDSV